MRTFTAPSFLLGQTPQGCRDVIGDDLDLLRCSRGANAYLRIGVVKQQEHLALDQSGSWLCGADTL